MVETVSYTFRIPKDLLSEIVQEAATTELSCAQVVIRRLRGNPVKPNFVSTPIIISSSERVLGAKRVPIRRDPKPISTKASTEGCKSCGSLGRVHQKWCDA